MRSLPSTSGSSAMGIPLSQMLGDAADIVCPAGNQNKADNLLVSGKNLAIKNVFFKE
jgi:hypothetical protein